MKRRGFIARAAAAVVGSVIAANAPGFPPKPTAKDNARATSKADLANGLPGLAFNKQGTMLTVRDGDKFHYYPLTTPFDMSTATFGGSKYAT